MEAHTDLVTNARVRTPKTHRRAKDSQSPISATPPNVMWPMDGYEASPFSPAGQSQAEWKFLAAAANRGSPTTRITVRVVLLFVAAVLVLGPVLEVVNISGFRGLALVIPSLLVIGLLTWFFGRMLSAAEGARGGRRARRQDRSSR